MPRTRQGPGYRRSPRTQSLRRRRLWDRHWMRWRTPMLPRLRVTLLGQGDVCPGDRPAAPITRPTTRIHRPIAHLVAPFVPVGLAEGGSAAVPGVLNVAFWTLRMGVRPRPVLDWR